MILCLRMWSDLLLDLVTWELLCVGLMYNEKERERGCEVKVINQEKHLGDS